MILETILISTNTERPPCLIHNLIKWEKWLSILCVPSPAFTVIQHWSTQSTWIHLRSRAFHTPSTYHLVTLALITDSFLPFAAPRPEPPPHHHHHPPTCTLLSGKTVTAVVFKHYMTLNTVLPGSWKPLRCVNWRFLEHGGMLSVLDASRRRSSALRAGAGLRDSLRAGRAGSAHHLLAPLPAPLAGFL